MFLSPGDYRPLAAYSAPAHERRELWRTVLGTLSIVALYVGSLILLSLYLRWRYGVLIAGAIGDGIARATTPGLALTLLFSFLGMALAPIAVTRALHARRAGTLFGPFRPLAADFARVAAAILAVTLLVLPLALSAEGTSRGLDLATFLAYLPVALIGLLTQTAAEELVFRGYLQQQLAARFRSPLAWMVLPSALFAFGHYLPGTYGPNALPIALWAGLFGLLAADLTARTGTLGAAIGFHFANNVLAFLFIGIKGDMDGLALWTRAVDLTDPAALWPLLSIDFAAMVVSWLAARLALGR